MHRLALGWFETWIQWGFWASIIYYLYALVVDALDSSWCRRQRDTFYALVISVSLTTVFGYWVLQVPISAKIGYGTPSHATWEALVENFISPSLYPGLAIFEFIFVSHRSGYLPVELILCVLFGLGFVVTDVTRYSLTKHFVYPIEGRAFGSYWVILLTLLILSFTGYRVANWWLLKVRRKALNTVCRDILYDSDFEDDSAQARRRLINEDVASTIRYGTIGSTPSIESGCLSISCPALTMLVIILTIFMIFLVNFLVRSHRTPPSPSTSSPLHPIHGSW